MGEAALNMHEVAGSKSYGWRNKDGQRGNRKAVPGGPSVNDSCPHTCLGILLMSTSNVCRTLLEKRGPIETHSAQMFQ